eukprot:scaffold18073_cov64-Cylindrotheca_fusiformis.AAC.1
MGSKDLLESKIEEATAPSIGKDHYAIAGFHSDPKLASGKPTNPIERTLRELKRCVEHLTRRRKEDGENE